MLWLRYINVSLLFWYMRFNTERPTVRPALAELTVDFFRAMGVMFTERNFDDALATGGT